MTGKIILTSVDKPIEGMHVYYEGDVYIIDSLPDELNDVRLSPITDCRGTIADISELKQIAVEYEEYDREATFKAGVRRTSKKTLPLHPDDWQWALSHIGEEMEFGVMEAGIEYGMDSGPFNPKVNTSKLILPKQEESWDEVYQKFKESEVFDREFMIGSFFSFLKENYLPPKRK